MFAQLGAFLAAVQSVEEKVLGNRFRIIAGMTATALTLGGCIPTTVPSSAPILPTPMRGWRA